MNKIKSYSLKKELRFCFFLTTVLTALSFSYLLVSFFDRGIESAIKIAITLEAKNYAREYKNNRDIASSSFFTDYYFDNLGESKEKYGDVFSNIKIPPNEFELVDSDLIVTEDGDFFYVIYHQILHDGKSLYVVSNFESKLLTNKDFSLIDNSDQLRVLIIVSYLMLALFAFWLYSIRISLRTQRLASWVEHLNAEKQTNNRPNFGYSEYELVADCMEKSLKQQAELTMREKRFLSHASHELRTPIAIIRANMDILDRVDTFDDTLIPLERIDRASNNMQLMAETLLWLNRKNSEKPRISEVNLRKIISSLMSDLEYLNSGENVQIELQCKAETNIILPTVPFCIVLNNLIRNAYQYTNRGWIYCHADEHLVTIENCDISVEHKTDLTSFGLGLELTQQICEKLGWELTINQREGGLIAKLRLPTQT